jgi:hypothetical protein
MKHLTLLISLLSAFCGTLAAQSVIKQSLNLPRAGDTIVKQQVQYKDPGRAGADVVWDFGQLEPMNEQYRLIYMQPRRHYSNKYILGKDTFLVDSGLIVGREHFTDYFYQLQGDSLLLTRGYQNNLDLMHHAQPLPLLKFPMTFGDSISTLTNSDGLFSGIVPMLTHGDISLVADAYGVMVVPSGDTLRQVLRTHSVQTILADSVREMDSIHVNTTIETYRWYARGYRYPVFETIRTIHKSPAPTTTDTISPPSGDLEGFEEDLEGFEADSAGFVIDVFETAFSYPPPQNQFAATNPDTANIAELARMEAEANSPFGGGSEGESPWAGLTYNVFPNPVISDLQFELYLPKPVQNLRIQIRNTMGLVFIDEQKGAYPEGISSFTFNMSGLSPNNYVLDFWLDGYLVHGAVVMKR